ncbi:hypothetical protein R1sor_008639 [Riccia sorocarpa]|uniref:Uncharacterized protein n=1 Tax=Riccia sorocarpa TaxID=122646 RepID=A0ABD3HUE0_9MARC
MATRGAWARVNSGNLLQKTSWQRRAILPALFTSEQEWLGGGLAWSQDQAGQRRIDCTTTTTTTLIGRMSHKILGPKVYDTTLAKKTLNRTEQTLPEKLLDSEDMMPLHQLLRNDEAIEDEFLSRTGALDQYLFRNLPDVSMQLGQEQHRREVCSTKLQEIERELQEFSEAFGNKLKELKKSIGEFAQTMKEILHYDEGTYIEDRLWEEADANSKAVDAVTAVQSPPQR